METPRESSGTAVSASTSGEALTVEQAGLVFASPAADADLPRFHRACAVLREQDPVHLVEHPEFAPFWAVTRYAHVQEIELHPGEFKNAPRPVLSTLAVDRQREERGDLLRTLIHVDDVEHQLLRNLTADWFRPRSLEVLQGRVNALADRAVAEMAGLGRSCDFARQIAMPYPLGVILATLGLPESDYDRIWQLTQELFGSGDPEHRSNGTPEELAAIVADFAAYFQALTADRRAEPTGDLASVIANGTIDGEPLGFLETLGYYMIIATAGHDTSASAIAGGLLALIEHPDELARLSDDLSLLDTAVDEMIRWSTPVRHFMRNLAVDYELDGKQLCAGDAVLLSYPSANRDESVFPDAERFDVSRTPNKHLAFGAGVHYCLGAHLARLEMKAIFRRLLPRLRHIELAGTPTYTPTLFVGGVKHLPIAYAME